MSRTIQPGHEDACRRCGVVPHDHEGLHDGLCPECYFSEITDSEGGVER